MHHLQLLFQFIFKICSEFITHVIDQENIVGENYFLNQSAKEAYRSYVLAYNSHAMKDIFNVHDLDMKVKLLLKFFLNAQYYHLHIIFSFVTTIH